MDLMKPIATEKVEDSTDWLYEIKYDGFRATITWTEKDIQIISKNKHDLTEKFPEIIAYCQKIQPTVSALLPLQLDGELVILNNAFQANFAEIQRRGRLKTAQTIKKLATERPATFMIFDMIKMKGKSIIHKTLTERKSSLSEVFQELQLSNTTRLQTVKSYSTYKDIADIVFQYKGEGVIAKRKNSKYISGKGHHDWFKEKNWRTIHTFLTQYDPDNGYYEVGIYDEDDIQIIGKCKHGLDEETAATLKTMFLQNGEKTHQQTYRLPPAICAKIHTLDLLTRELREPQFAQILPNEQATECTKARLQEDLAMFPDVDLSKLDKIFWPEKNLTKGNLLTYIREIFPYMIPYLRHRALTIIRSPDGVEEEFFYQKHLPSYAPSYINYVEEEGKRNIVCNQLESLVWFANHGAIEYHVPFQTISTTFPSEIVFDLDPPSREKFGLAVTATQMIKNILDELELISFVKTSGNKGLQIYIPLPLHQVSYEQTAVLTEAIALTLEKAEPTLFTTERMKKNRGGKLYIDYVQHGQNKTIIAPYSPRKTNDATVATPLYWHEVTDTLRPEQFTIENVIDRVQRLGCPWLYHFEEARDQKLEKVEQLIGQ